MIKKMCEVDGCPFEVSKHHRCSHHQRVIRQCQHCGGPIKAHGWCKLLYDRWLWRKKYGKPGISLDVHKPQYRGRIKGVKPKKKEKK